MSDGATEEAADQRSRASRKSRNFWTLAQRRNEDLALITNAAVSDKGEPSQRDREHAAMARRLLSIEAERLPRP